MLTVKPGPGSFFQDVAFVHKSSRTLLISNPDPNPDPSPSPSRNPNRTLLICDAILAVTEEPP